MSVQTNGGFPIARCQDCQGRFTEDPQTHPEITTQGPPSTPGAPGHERIDAWGTVICRVRALVDLGWTGWVLETLRWQHRLACHFGRSTPVQHGQQNNKGPPTSKIPWKTLETGSSSPWFGHPNARRRSRIWTGHTCNHWDPHVVSICFCDLARNEQKYLAMLTLEYIMMYNHI